MTAEIIQFRPRRKPCRHCHGGDRDASLILNVGSKHYGVCLDHDTCWLIGSDLFFGWELETEKVWAANKAYLETFRCIDDEPFGGAA